jgi:hypothetical protein
VADLKVFISPVVSRFEEYREAAASSMPPHTWAFNSTSASLALVSSQNFHKSPGTIAFLLIALFTLPLRRD